MYYTEDAIEQVKKIRAAILECKKLCSEDQSATPLQKKIVETLGLLAEPVEINLMCEYRFDGLDVTGY